MKTARQCTQRPEATRKLRGRLAAGVLVFAVAAALAGPAGAHRDHPDYSWSRDPRAPGSLVDVQVLMGGKSVPVYFSASFADRRYFEAECGRNYALAIRNRTGRRIGVLLAVDGINVVNGERSHLGRTEPMYVLDPYASATIRGWRTSLEHVRQFVFVDEQRSYANRTDQANGDMGWIRILTFEEERPVAVCPLPEPHWYDRGPFGWWSAPGSAPDRRERAGRPQSTEGAADEMAAAEPSAPPPTAAQPPSNAAQKGAAPEVQGESRAPAGSEGKAQARAKLAEEAYPGTGWGTRRRDVVREVEFAPAVAASDHIVLRYEYASGLAALGIFPDDDRLWNRERGEFSFARPPRW